MSRIGAGRRYAEAAFELAVRDDKVDAWQRDLALAAEMARDERVVRVVDNPAVSFGERRKVVEQLLGKHVSPQALNLALLLAKRGRFGVLPSVSSEYDAKVRQTRGIVAATVTTPEPLSATRLAAVRARVEQLAGAKVELATEIDPALIGGLTIKIGDRLIDASVRGRLERLRGRLIQGTT
ncbi:MAG TPA: ATP synthase F1 subunit delta [Candidatus Limnocylindrales bacterium]|jgi:F-type H+-transporting ATPase subunit delta